MATKITLLVTILFYSVIVSQSFMYILSLKNTQLALGGGSYTELRQLIDANMRHNFKYVIYLTLFANLLLVILNSKTPSGLMFITAAIALVALVIDVLLTLKGNVPVNDIINSWSTESYPDNWREVRDKWFTIFRYRQMATITGFLSLLAGAVFGGRG